MWADSGEDTEFDPSGLGAAKVPHVQRIHLQVVHGSSQGKALTTDSDIVRIGSHPSNDLVIEDKRVSRFHCELHFDAAGIKLIDKESRNGTELDGVRILQAIPKEGSEIRIGSTLLRFQLGKEQIRVPLSDATEFGLLRGSSVAMRAAFAAMAKAADNESPVLIEGESGTGKEEAAISIHEASERKSAPFVIVDCATTNPKALEIELWGAQGTPAGALEAARGGTVLLEEISALNGSMQTKLLRAIEQKQVVPVGDHAPRALACRVIVSTGEDLRQKVNTGHFSSELFQALAINYVRMPALRQRPDDMTLLVEEILDNVGADPDSRSRLLSEESIASLKRSAWPGNLRQLRTYIERCLVSDEPAPLTELPIAVEGSFEVDAKISYTEARKRAVDEFERRYVHALLTLHEGNVSKAAREAGMHRVYLHRLLRRHQQGANS